MSADGFRFSQTTNTNHLIGHLIVWHTAVYLERRLTRRRPVFSVQIQQNDDRSTSSYDAASARRSGGLLANRGVRSSSGHTFDRRFAKNKKKVVCMKTNTQKGFNVRSLISDRCCFLLSIIDYILLFTMSARVYLSEGGLF